MVMMMMMMVMMVMIMVMMMMMMMIIKHRTQDYLPLDVVDVVDSSGPSNKKNIFKKKVSIKKITEIMKTEKKIAASYLNLF